MSGAKLALIGFLLLAFFGCSETEKRASLSEKSREVVTMRGFHMVQTELGVKKYEIDSAEAYLNPRIKKMRFSNVRTRYYEKDKEIANLTSETGVIYTDTNNIEVKGKVVLTTRDNAKLLTSSLSWDSKKNKLHTDEYVKVIRGDNVMEGVGFQSDIMLERVLIKKVITKIADIDEFKRIK